MRGHKKTTQELTKITTNIIGKLEEEDNIDDIDFISLFEDINESFRTEDNLNNLVKLKNALDILMGLLKTQEKNIFERLTNSNTRVTAHKAYISSAKR